MPDLIHQEEDLFYTAWNQADPAMRRAFLDEVCGHNTALRAMIENRLAIQADAEQFFADAARFLNCAPEEFLEALDAHLINRGVWHP